MFLAYIYNQNNYTSIPTPSQFQQQICHARTGGYLEGVSTNFILNRVQLGAKWERDLILC